MTSKKFSTRVLHTPFLKKDVYGSLHMPVYDTVSFEFDTAEDMESAFNGRNPDHVYSRISNPTVEHLEQRIKYVTGALNVTALASGMAAISNLIIAITRSGDNIITSKHLFGNTYSLFERTLKPFGLNVKYTDLTRPEMVGELIDNRTRAVFFETITNPQLEVADINLLSALANKKNVLLIADTTVSPPCLFKSKQFGVDIEVISSTKSISGGATSMGGLILDYGTYDWSYNEKLLKENEEFGPYALNIKLKREVFRNLGACMSPHNAWLQSLGLETLALRTDRSCTNCLSIAEYLKGIPGITNVNYPGLKDSRYYELSKSQFGNTPCAILTFDLESGAQCFRFMNQLKIIRRATNLNDNKTLIIHPASTIFCEYSTEEKRQMNIRDTMIRLAVGIEDNTDLVNDIDQAIKIIR